MGKKLPRGELKRYKTIDEILWNDWDPIGVNDVPQARDEYQGYLAHIFRLAVEGKSAEHISSSLVATIEGNIGLSADNESCYRVAEKIVDAKNEILG